MSPDLFSVERETYNTLDFLGDCGGLWDGLFIIVKIAISPISVFALQSTLLTNFFRFKTSRNNLKAAEDETLRDEKIRYSTTAENTSSLNRNMAQDFKRTEKILP